MWPSASNSRSRHHKSPPSPARCALWIQPLCPRSAAVCRWAHSFGTPPPVWGEHEVRLVHRPHQRPPAHFINDSGDDAPVQNAGIALKMLRCGEGGFHHARFYLINAQLEPDRVSSPQMKQFSSWVQLPFLHDPVIFLWLVKNILLL